MCKGVVIIPGFYVSSPTQLCVHTYRYIQGEASGGGGGEEGGMSVCVGGARYCCD